MAVTFNGQTVDAVQRRGAALDELDSNENKVWPESVVNAYITFSSAAAFTLAVDNATKNWDGTLEYSSNASTWTVWDGTTTLSSQEKAGKYFLYVRGYNNTYITGAESYSLRWVLTGTSVSCDGDIRTLLDYADPENTTMANYCFAYLFYSGQYSDYPLVKAPDLPSMVLSDYCYLFMFFGSNNLLTTPELPATTLKLYFSSLPPSGVVALTEGMS